jgi:LPP20 lipoprotein
LFSPMLALLLAAGPPGTGHRPAWIDRESPQWPREMYVLGVGSADDREAAEDRARADLARVFETHVSSVLAANESESSVKGDRGASYSGQISVSDETRSTTDKVLEGVEIVEVWQDPETKQIYALAALDRQQAAARLDARLDALEQGAKPLRARLETPDKADGLAAALRLLRVERERRAVQQELGIVAPGRPPRAGVNEETAARQFISRLSVAVAIKGDRSGVIRDAVVSGLTAAGFTVKPDAEQADLRGAGTVSVQSLGLKDGWYWSRANVGVALQDPASSRVVINLTANARDASRVESESDRRVLKKVSDKVRTQIPAAVASWADNQP